MKYYKCKHVNIKNTGWRSYYIVLYFPYFYQSPKVKKYTFYMNGYLDKLLGKILKDVRTPNQKY